ncbi:MAG TPA: N-acetylmuramic acid 6-phosphate etherase [Verrucomicrobiales bacterium]|nr:N-acetylmuramic acid 6-phosphate etherase [Verrucomicrobiales bacterium]HIL69473.1 N-acetylmuramic acid 6-phosphate etherase [Verrucomicrobiota bacterium]
MSSEVFLGIEGGGTKTLALSADQNGDHSICEEFGPCNLQLISDRKLLSLFREIHQRMPVPRSVAVGLAGAYQKKQQGRIVRIAGQVWKGVSCYPTHDLETAIYSAKDDWSKTERARIVLISGTGSCCYGRSFSGKTARAGGWGHLLGDVGSGYDISITAVKECLRHYDRTGVLPKLGQLIAAELQINSPRDFIEWVHASHKGEIAALAPIVFQLRKRRDAIASRIVSDAAQRLTEDALDCHRRLVRGSHGVRFLFAGSVLLRQSGFAASIQRKLQHRHPHAIIEKLERESVWGAWKLAVQHSGCSLEERGLFSGKSRSGYVSANFLIGKNDEEPFEVPAQRAPSPTEQRNPRSKKLDRMSDIKGVELMLKEDRLIPEALWKERRKISKVLGWITQAFATKGRLFYVGAGTSGRLGILDASECPPTFRTDPEQVQGIIAGGSRAIVRSVEAAEDNPQAGKLVISTRGIHARDVVIGIAASGRTPFVWGAIQEAAHRGAKTVMLCFNPHLIVPRTYRPDLVIAPDLGPEILTGSTRLKSGTATKCILNIWTTLAMVQSGKVIENLMVDLNPSNIKLRDRAIRIVVDLAEVDYQEAEETLKAEGWTIKNALKRLNRI